MGRLGRPSPALVVACVALAVALGGTGYAAIKLPENSVGTRQLKKDAVVASKVKDRSLTRIDFKQGEIPKGPRGDPGVRGLTGAAGAQGPTGPRGPRGQRGAGGPAGPVGAQGPPGIGGLETVPAHSGPDSSSPKFAFAQCPTGKKVISGSVSVTGPGETDVALTRSDATDSRTWEGEAHEHTSSTREWTLNVVAICAAVAG